MIDAVAKDGYAYVAVEHVLRHSGASRSTFYEQFTDKNDCFLAAQREIADRLLRTLELEARLDDPSAIHETVIRVLVHFACAEQPAARLLLIETLAAGPRALDVREEMASAFEGVLERSWKRAPEDAPQIDLSAKALVGSVLRLLAIRMRRGEGAMHNLQDELILWVQSYRVAPGTPLRWRKLSHTPRPQLLSEIEHAAMPTPGPLPRGRHKLSATEVARNQCDRILYAVAELANEMGYAAMTVTDICARSRVSRKVFYTHYVDKQAAALEAHELGFRQTMSVSSRAFFGASGWPERVWEAGRAFARFLVDYPAIAWLGFAESYAIGPAAIQRAEDSQVSFTIFLQEGYQLLRESEPSPTAVEAIAATIFELVYQEVRRKRTAGLASVLPDITYMCLAPFIGTQAANLFIDAKLQSSDH
ncbi:MAG TPA: TetR/AcrR family transcriptional regulator [Solirubrobacteraceae bacterium]